MSACPLSERTPHSQRHSPLGALDIPRPEELAAPPPLDDIIAAACVARLRENPHRCGIVECPAEVGWEAFARAVGRIAARFEEQGWRLDVFATPCHPAAVLVGARHDRCRGVGCGGCRRGFDASVTAYRASPDRGERILTRDELSRLEAIRDAAVKLLRFKRDLWDLLRHVDKHGWSRMKTIAVTTSLMHVAKKPAGDFRRATTSSGVSMSLAWEDRHRMPIGPDEAREMLAERLAERESWLRNAIEKDQQALVKQARGLLLLDIEAHLCGWFDADRSLPLVDACRHILAKDTCLPGVPCAPSLDASLESLRAVTDDDVAALWL